MEDREKIALLRQEIEKHNYNYYVLSSPTISDQEYDAKVKELQHLEQMHPSLFSSLSPTQHVGSDLNPSSSNFQRITHAYPMLSLANTYNSDEVHEWMKKLPPNTEIVCELKFDGLGISLHYENGTLLYALTRGDGQKGDNVIENIKTIPNIPLQLSDKRFPSVFEMRGEILLPWHNFDKLNMEREENGEPLFANPRNAASGTLKLLDKEEVKRRGLTSFLYYMLSDHLPFSTHYECLQYAKQCGFPISDAITVCRNTNEVMSFIQKWDEKRHDLPFAIDGIVLKVNNLLLQQQLGSTAKTPKWAIAYKYQPETQTTRLKKITFQVGRTGVITPVAELDPIHLSGTIVKRATLHNANFIKQLDLHVNDTVAVEKGGEIIPKITAVVQHNNDTSDHPFAFPTTCPQCGTPLVQHEGEVAWYCPNDTSCPPQQVFKIAHFVSRKAMNIDGIGIETIKTLYQKNLIRNVADLYTLQLHDIATLDGLGDKSARKILDSIQKSKSRKWENVLFALGIRMVGETMAKKITKHLTSYEQLKEASLDQLMSIEDVGEQVAANIIAFLHNPNNEHLINQLQDFGIQLQSSAESEKISSILENEKIIISGIFKYHTREEYKTLIERNGGTNVSSISKQTSMVLAGENMGEAKKKKAIELNIPIISEDEFLQRIHIDNK